MSAIAERAKKAFLDLVSVQPQATLKQFSERTEELLGEAIGFDTIRHYSSDGGWMKLAEETRRNAETDWSQFMLDLSYGKATSATSATDIEGFTRSYLNVLNTLSSDVLAEEQNRIRNLKRLIFDTVHKFREAISASLLRKLTAIYAGLDKAIRGDASNFREPGIDIDGFLLKVSGPDVMTTARVRRLEGSEVEELLKCHGDVVYLVKEYGWLKHTSRGAIRWDKPYPYQIDMLRALQNGSNIITLKSRQIGCSWTTAAYIVWLMMFHPDIEIIILSKSELYAIKFLEKAKFFFNRLPAFLKPSVTASSQTQFTFTFRSSEGVVGSTTAYSLTTTTDSGRSFSARFVAMDEAAYLPNGEATWGAVKPATGLGGQIAVISTPNGMGNFYHRLWLRVEHGESQFVPIKAYWKDCGFDEKWYEIVTDGFTTQQILQEYECVFLAAGNPFFDLNHLALCYKPLSEYPELVDRNGNNLRQQTLMSFSGIDTQEGTNPKTGERDYNSAVTLNEFGVQIAAYHSQKDGLDKWAGYTLKTESRRYEVEGFVTKWHRKYPGVMAIESNGPGSTVINRHVLPDDEISYMVPRRTTGGMAGLGSKIRLMNGLKLAFAGRMLIVTDAFTYECLLAFQDKGNSKTEAAAGMYDDPVIALAEAWAELVNWGGLTFELPNELSAGQRMVALHSTDDIPADMLDDVLTVGHFQEGPVYSPDNRRMVDDFVSTTRLLEPP